MKAHLSVREWRSKFGAALPVGFSCRSALPDRWLRIHSLPFSKRYASTPAERSELLRRHNAVATDLLGEGSSCVMVIARFGDETNWVQYEETLVGKNVPEHVLSANDNGDHIQFFALPVIWQEHTFDALISAIADDKSAPILFANMLGGSIYAPYDGGADLFFPSMAGATMARHRFQTWLSTREDGL